MALNPILVIKIMEGNKIGVRARLKDEFVEHEIVLNSILAYYNANDFPPVEKFLELFDSVIKRTINELIPHKNLYLKYDVKADSTLDKASKIEINLIEVKTDDINFKIDGKHVILGFSKSNEEIEEQNIFEETIEKVIETPEFVLKKYRELNGKN